VPAGELRRARTRLSPGGQVSLEAMEAVRFGKLAAQCAGRPLQLVGCENLDGEL
jgi:hypothetical protein